MTKRERYLKALRNKPVDEIVWAPNFDYWLKVNTAEGALPKRYEGMSRNDIVRSLGGTIWNRAVGLRTVLDASVSECSVTDFHGNRVHSFATPLGTIREVHSATTGEGHARASHLSEHLVKDLDSLRILQYVVEATHYEPDYQPTLTALQDTGEDGIVLNSYFSVPFIQFAKIDVGYVNAFYMWTDHREKVDALLSAYTKNFLEGYAVLAAGPADVIASGDNMDGTMISPSIFGEYAVPFYREASGICHAGHKLFEAHWCGRTQTLLPSVPGCGLDIVEAIVTKPMADLSITEALSALRGEAVLQGGIPSVLVCEEGGSYQSFEQYMRTEVHPLRGRKGFVLGMADNVPPNAEFARIEAVAALIR